jgi:hypothetical protein
MLKKQTCSMCFGKKRTKVPGTEPYTEWEDCTNCHGTGEVMVEVSVKMRAKLKVTKVESAKAYERITFAAVCKSNGYPPDGTDENNTYAKWTPQADLAMVINNPDLLGAYKVGDEVYVDFTACH